MKKTLVIVGLFFFVISLVFFQNIQGNLIDVRTPTKSAACEDASTAILHRSHNLVGKNKFMDVKGYGDSDKELRRSGVLESYNIALHALFNVMTNGERVAIMDELRILKESERLATIKSSVPYYSPDEWRLHSDEIINNGDAKLELQRNEALDEYHIMFEDELVPVLADFLEGNAEKEIVQDIQDELNVLIEEFSFTEAIEFDSEIRRNKLLKDYYQEFDMIVDGLVEYYDSCR